MLLPTKYQKLHKCKDENYKLVFGLSEHGYAPEIKLEVYGGIFYF